MVPHAGDSAGENLARCTDISNQVKLLKWFCTKCVIYESREAICHPQPRAHISVSRDPHRSQRFPRPFGSALFLSLKINAGDPPPRSGDWTACTGDGLVGSSLLFPSLYPHFVRRSVFVVAARRPRVLREPLSTRYVAAARNQQSELLHSLPRLCVSSSVVWLFLSMKNEVTKSSNISWGILFAPLLLASHGWQRSTTYR